MGKDYKETSDKEEPWSQNTSVLEQALVMGRGELSSQYQSSSSEVTKTNRFGNHVGGKEKWAFFCVVGRDLCTTRDRTAYTQVRPMPLMPFSSECPLEKLCLPVLGHKQGGTMGVGTEIPVTAGTVTCSRDKEEERLPGKF